MLYGAQWETWLVLSGFLGDRWELPGLVSAVWSLEVDHLI